MPLRHIVIYLASRQILPLDGGIARRDITNREMRSVIFVKAIADAAKSRRIFRAISVYAVRRKC